MPDLYVGQDKEYANIESALAFCKEGDTIVVLPGRYEESLNVTVPDVTISAKTKGDVTISSRPGEDAWNTIEILASHVTLQGLIVEGQSNTSLQRGSNDCTSCVQVQGTDVIIAGCTLNGSCSIGIKTFAKRTTVQDCDIDTGQSAVIVLGGASATIEDSRMKSAQDTGIWLWGASSCAIEKVVVNECGNTGIWLDSAPARLTNVEVTQCGRGIVCDWPTTYPLGDDEYFGLSHQGHLLNAVSVTESGENGIHVYPGVRVVVKECGFKDNGDCGVYFEGYIDEHDEENQEVRRKRSENCDQSVVQDSEMMGNKGYGVEAESNGLVVLMGENEFSDNVKGDCENVAAPGKRARVASGANNEPDANETHDGDAQPSVSGVSNAGSSATSRGSENAQEDLDRANAPDLEARLDDIAVMPGVCPVAVVTAKAGIKTPVGWQPGLIFTGEVNVDSFPSINNLYQWYINNPVRPNSLVEIKPSPGRGRGLYAAKKLREGTLVCFYSGHLRPQQTVHEGDYVMKYRPIGAKHDKDNEWEIDAEFGGSEARYANEPNKDEEANMVSRYRKRNGRQVIALEMLKDVEGGEELLWDYGEDYGYEEE